MVIFGINVSRRPAIAVASFVVIAAATGAAAFLLMRDSGGDVKAGAFAEPTETATASPTDAASPTAAATPTAVLPPQPFPPRTQQRQEDKCGEFTVVRQAGEKSATHFDSSDSISVLAPDGVTILDLPSRGTFTEGPDAAVVKSCYDLDGDGTMELLTQVRPGGSNAPGSTLYRLTSPVQKLADLEGLVLAAEELDGQAPTELIGTDYRWMRFATGTLQSTYPMIVLQLKSGKVSIVTGSFPDLVRADRDRNMGYLPRCLELVRYSDGTGFDACHIGALTSIMVDSLFLGDWETFRQQSKIDSTVAARFDDCREYMLAKATTLAEPTSLCHFGEMPTAVPRPTLPPSPATTPVQGVSANRIGNIRVERPPPAKDEFVSYRFTVDYTYSGDNGNIASIVGRPDCELSIYWSHELIRVGAGTAQFSVTPRNRPDSNLTCNHLVVFFANEAFTTFWGDTSFDIVTSWGD